MFLSQVESVVDEILVSNRQGRNIEGFDQLYADPEVKNALQLGNETIARTYIRDKLCSLGLMNVSMKYAIRAKSDNIRMPSKKIISSLR